MMFPIEHGLVAGVEMLEIRLVTREGERSRDSSRGAPRAHQLPKLLFEAYDTMQRELVHLQESNSQLSLSPPKDLQARTPMSLVCRLFLHSFTSGCSSLPSSAGQRSNS